MRNYDVAFRLETSRAVSFASLQSLYVSIANHQAEAMLRISAEFGFTPAARGRIAIPRDEEPTLFSSLEVTKKPDGP